MKVIWAIVWNVVIQIINIFAAIFCAYQTHILHLQVQSNYPHKLLTGNEIQDLLINFSLIDFKSFLCQYHKIIKLFGKGLSLNATRIILSNVCDSE